MGKATVTNERKSLLTAVYMYKDIVVTVNTRGFSTGNKRLGKRYKFTGRLCVVYWPYITCVENWLYSFFTATVKAM